MQSLKYRFDPQKHYQIGFKIRKEIAVEIFNDQQLLYNEYSHYTKFSKSQLVNINRYFWSTVGPNQQPSAQGMNRQQFLDIVCNSHDLPAGLINAVKPLFLKIFSLFDTQKSSFLGRHSDLELIIFLNYLVFCWS